jgi:hypothetical protein
VESSEENIIACCCLVIEENPLLLGWNVSVDPNKGLLKAVSCPLDVNSEYRRLYCVDVSLWKCPLKAECLTLSQVTRDRLLECAMSIISVIKLGQFNYHCR